jgi:hypothetical protein
VDGTGAICDAEGIDRTALEQLLLRHDLDKFPSEKLNVGGFILYRQAGCFGEQMRSDFLFL